LHSLGRRNAIKGLVVALAGVCVAAALFRPDEGTLGAHFPRVELSLGTPRPSWAKIYLGAAITSARSLTLFGLSDWQVSFSTQASPVEIDEFYQRVSTETGFTDAEVLVGMRYFKRNATRDEFSYLMLPVPGGTEVAFRARSWRGSGG